MDHLDIHRGFARLARALAVDAVLADEHEGVCEQIEGDGKASALWTHHELVVVEFAGFVFIHRHKFLGNTARIGEIEGGRFIEQDAIPLVW